MIIRVLYRLSFIPSDLDALHEAWEAVVRAHAAAGHGALESVLLVDDETLGDPRAMATAISRWQSREHWELQRTDDVDLEAYGRFRALCEVEDKIVLREVAVIQGNR
ncbi:MAG: hypothetical protein ACNA8W_17845 [Bradymonadaceae bacterium]